MKYGDLVKIEDIGPLATFISRNGDELELELFGDRFWIPERLVESVEGINLNAA